MSGSVSYHAGQAAEDSVARRYERRGLAVVARRWRGRGGEIDLILRDGDAVVFVEVKKSRSFDAAAAHVSPRQIERIMTAAQEFLDGEPRGQLTEIRFDVALVNGTGEVRVIENAFAV
ncbi:putative endonuclease [Rhodovulum sp. ES.010]|uniref:YraN family protein n=1 Tax=Rhodovulum sp. ES.010 TaxID=1882821 RepID=UPI0009285CA2|nr:YraN family protein [Rhodovulum sp. ES.010]SIO40162.1 putative endonuclease [Rhodovulum sp. ES.010]